MNILKSVLLPLHDRPGTNLLINAVFFLVILVIGFIAVNHYNDMIHFVNPDVPGVQVEKYSNLEKLLYVFGVTVLFFAYHRFKYN